MPAVLWNRDESARVVDLISKGARRWTAGELEAIVSLARKQKPDGYDAHVSAVRDMYEGAGIPYVDAELRRRFKRTHESMPRISLNYVRHIAQQDSGFYQYEPARAIVVDGEELEAENPRAVAFADLVKRAKMSSVMPEVERRAHASRTVFTHALWERGPRIDLYWPCDVGVVCHPLARASLDTAYILVARVAGPEGPQDRKEWYQVWSREPTDRPEDLGRWSSIVVSTKGDVLASTPEPIEYPGQRFPWATLSIGIPAGGIYLDDERDLIRAALAINVSRCSEQYVMDLQGHTPITYSGHQVEKESLAWGPGAVLKVASDETIGTLPLDPKLEDMRAGRSLALRELATTRGNNPDAYAVDVGPAESGVARQIKNIPHETRLREVSHYFVDFETAQLLPILVDVHDTFSGEAPIGAAEFSVVQTKPPDYEDPEARQRRALEAKDAGLISQARAAVECGWYRTITDAVGAGLSDELGRKPALGGFSAALQSRNTPAVDVVDDDADNQDQQQPPQRAQPQEQQQADTPQPPTINEITLGIERMGRLGDVDAANLLRRKLAELLGVAYEGDIDAATLGAKAAQADPTIKG